MIHPNVYQLCCYKKEQQNGLKQKSGKVRLDVILFDVLTAREGYEDLMTSNKVQLRSQLKRTESSLLPDWLGWDNIHSLRGIHPYQHKYRVSLPIAELSTLLILRKYIQIPDTNTTKRRVQCSTHNCKIH